MVVAWLLVFFNEFLFLCTVILSSEKQVAMIRQYSLQGIILFLFFCAGFSWNGSYAQASKQQRDSLKEVNVQNWLESRQFQFVAQNAVPMNGSTRLLTTEYDLGIRKDQVLASLPYFGQAYSVNIGQSNGGIQFKSSVFEYDKVAAKKGGWDITIKPKDVKEDVYRLFLHVSKSGFSSLQVSCNNRQPITFNGYIKDLK